MRQTVILGLFFALLLAPLVGRRAVVHSPGGGSAPSRRLVVITPHNQDIRREFARAFADWYRQRYQAEVSIDYRTPGGTSDIERQLRSTYAAVGEGQKVVSAIDVVWGGGDFFFETLKKANLLQPMALDPALLRQAYPEPTLAGVKLYDTPAAEQAPRPQWVGVCLSSFGIVYNAQVYEALTLPRPTSWNDLANPRLFGFLALADPSHSGSAAVAYMMVLQRSMADAEEALFAAHPEIKRLPRAARSQSSLYQQAIGAGWKRGMGQLVLIAANARYFADGAEMVPNDVSRGDAAAGMAIDFYARTTEQIVGPQRARFVLPVQATAITPDPVAILRGVEAERLELAIRFVQFLLIPDAQRLWALKKGEPGGPTERSLMRAPIRRDVYADRTGWEAIENPFQSGGNFNQRGEWMGLLADTRMVWVAAWIDSRDALRAARAKIDRSAPARQAALLKDLADLPISLDEVAGFSAQQKQHAAAPELWRATLQTELAERFRRHYARVAAQAG